MEPDEIEITAGDRRFNGRFFDTGGGRTGRRGILFVHGRRSSQEGYKPRAESVARSLDAVCLTFDLSGHGADAEHFNQRTVYDHLDDVIAAYDKLEAHPGVDGTRIGVSGASYGGYLAALLTARRPVKRLILRAPTLATNHHFPEQAREPSASGGGRAGFDSLRILRDYSGDVLVIESERDEVIPPSTIAAYVRASSRSQHLLIPEATHELKDPGWNVMFVNAIIDWFREL